MNSFKQKWQHFGKQYAAFVEKQGFMIILTACIGVIAATAVWTSQTSDAPAAPTPPVGQAASVAQLQQQSLSDVSTPAPATAAPVVWHAPLEDISVLRAFDATRMTRSGVTGLWQLHDAVDLACETGDLVRAMMDGTVAAVEEKGLMGVCITIDHGEGIAAQYAGMELSSGLQRGDPVQAGQTIGFAGNGVVDETDLPPHLHLRLTRHGQAIDPMLLVRQTE